MKVLVTGASGYLGQRVVQGLLDEGHEVRGLVRGHGAGAAKLPPAVERVEGDVRDPASLQAACAGMDAVAHLVAILREVRAGGRQVGVGPGPLSPATYASVNVEGTRNVVEAARHAGAKRFVHVSALGAANKPALRYVHSKWQGEQFVRGSGLDDVIVRSSVIFGPGFGFLDRLVQSIRMSPPPIVPLPAGGRTRFQPISVHDAARCVVLSLTAQPGTIAEVGGPEHLSYADILGRVMKALRVRRLPVPVPMGLMKPVVPLMGMVFKDPPVTPEELAQLPYDNVTDERAVSRIFGFEPQPMTVESLAYLRGEG